MNVSKALKPFLLFFASAVVLIIFALVLPFLVDLNHLKPQIQDAVSEKLHAKLEFSSLRLRVFPSVGFVLKDVSLINTSAPFENTELFAVDEVDFDVKLMPLFSRKFIGNISIDEPSVRFAKTAETNNFSELVKDSDKTSQTEPPQEKKGSTGIEGIKESVVIESFRIDQANVQVLEKVGAAFDITSRVSNLDLLVTDIGFDRDIKVELRTDVASRTTNANINGPIFANVTAKVQTAGDAISLVDFDGLISLDQLTINVRDAFVKNSDVPLHVKFKGKTSLKDILIEKIDVVFHNLHAEGRLQIDNFETLPVQGSLALSNDDISALEVVLPKHRDLLMDGKITLNAGIEGALSQFQQVRANLNLDAVLNGSDFSLSSDLTSIQPIKVQTKLSSKLLDLDRLLEPFQSTGDDERAATSDDHRAGEPSGEVSTGGEGSEEFILSDELKPFFAGSRSNLNIELARVLFRKNSIENFSLSLSLKDFTGSLDHFKFNGFDGTFASSGSVQLNAHPIKYKGSLKLEGVAVDTLTAALMPQFADTVKGILGLHLDVTGTGSTWALISKSVSGDGSFTLQQAELSSVNLTEAMEQRVNQFVDEASVVQAADDVFNDASKLLQNPLVKKLPQGSTVDLATYKKAYDSFKKVDLSGKLRDKKLADVKGKVQIKDGRIFITSSDVTSGGQFSFNGSVGLDTTLQGESTFVASPQLQQQLQAQSKYASLLNNSSGRLEIPAELGGTVKSPQINVNMSQLKENFVKNARAVVSNEVKGSIEKQLGAGQAKEKLKTVVKEKEEKAKQKAKAEAEKQIDKHIKDEKTRDKIKDKLKGLW